MYGGIETSHSVGQMDVAISTAVQAVDNAQVARRRQQPEHYHQRLHTIQFILTISAQSSHTKLKQSYKY